MAVVLLLCSFSRAQTTVFCNKVDPALVAVSNSAAGSVVKAGAGASLWVCPGGSLGTPCAPLSLLYNPQGTAINNPMTADSSGNFGQVCVDTPGRYMLQVGGIGFNTNTVDGIVFPNDPQNPRFSSLTVSGAVNRLGKECYVGGASYATISAAYTDTTNCSLIFLPPGYTETLSSTLTFNRNSVPVICLGVCTITQGANQVVISSGTKDVYIGAPFSPWGTDSAGGNFGLNFVGYTGSAEAFKIGDSTADTIKVKLENVYVRLTSAAGGAIGVRLNRVTNNFEMKNVSVFQGGVSGQICFLLDGTGNFTGIGSFYDLECQSAVGNTNGIAIRETGLVSDVKYFGGHITLTSGGTSVGLDLAGPAANASEATIFNLAIDNVQTGVTVESTFGGNLWGFLRIDSTVPNIANFGAGTVGNTIFVNSNAAYTDSGTNSVIYQPQFQVNTQLWQYSCNASGCGVKDVQSGGNSGGWFCTHAGNCTFGSAGGGANQNILVGNTGTLVPGTVNVAQLGTTGLPWVKTCIGLSANNSMCDSGGAFTGNLTRTWQNSSGTVGWTSGTVNYQLGCTGTAVASNTVIINAPSAQPACTNTTVARPITKMTSAGTLKNLFAQCTTGGVNASSGVVSVRVNGVAGAITCTLGTGTSCSDTTHTASTAAGDEVNIQFTTQAAETLANCEFAFEKQ